MGKDQEDNICICGRCKKKFAFKDAVIKKHKLYTKEIEEKACPFCGSTGFSPTKEIYWLGVMASQHTADGKRGKPAQ